jgi:hypothetical protein
MTMDHHEKHIMEAVLKTNLATKMSEFTQGRTVITRKRKIQVITTVIREIPIRVLGGTGNPVEGPRRQYSMVPYQYICRSVYVCVRVCLCDMVLHE